MSSAMRQAKENLQKKGYLDIEIDATLDLIEAINKLKKEKNMVLLAHYYQDSEIQDIAEYIGVSLGLAQQAASTSADIIVFAGVHFMAETAKILNPSKKVILPDLKAGCSLADSCPADVFAAFKAKHPEHIVISYINCTAELKTLTDVVVTSTNAEYIVNEFPFDQKIIFAPDKNLGAYLNKKTGRNMLLWDGACMVHEIFSLEKLIKLKVRHPKALVIAHPECEAAILNEADFIGSTTALLNFALKSEHDEFIVLTESGILHQMEKQAPHKKFIPAPPNNNCACNDCPYMKLNTLEKLYNCMKYELPEIILSDEIIALGRKPIDRMLEISAKHKL